MDLEFALFLLETKIVAFLHMGLVESMLVLIVRLKPKLVLKLLVSMVLVVVDLRLCPCCDSGHMISIDLSGG
jgi:hypothetical protein